MTISRLTVTLGALAAAGFATFEVARPAKVDGADTLDGFASSAWVLGHLSGAAGFIALTGLFAVLAVRRPSRLRIAAAVLSGLGGALTLLYFGAETFALHALGQRGAADGAGDLLALGEEIRSVPAALSAFGVGLLLVGAAGVCLLLDGRGSWRRSVAPLAALLVGYLAHFYLPPAGRIGYGLALAAAVLLAVLAEHRAGRATTGAASATASGAEVAPATARPLVAAAR